MEAARAGRVARRAVAAAVALGERPKTITVVQAAPKVIPTAISAALAAVVAQGVAVG